MEGNTPAEAPKRTWTRYVLPIAIVLVVGAIAGGIMYQIQKSPCTILVNGKPVTSVESRFIAKRVLAAARELKAHGAPSDVLRFADKVTIRGASASVETSDVPEAVRAVEESASVEAELYAINIDGTPIIGLKNKADADRTLELVKKYYEKGLQNLAGKSTFKGDVFVERRFIGTDKFRLTPEDACNTLTSISEPALTHMIQPGDRAVHLPAQYGISLDELKALNPGVDLDRLTEGNQLIIRRAKQPITVITKSIVTKTETISPPTDAMRYGSTRTGKRVMRMMVTYENGRPASQEIISQITTWDRPKSSYSEEGSYSSSRRHYRHYRRSRQSSE